MGERRGPSQGETHFLIIAILTQMREFPGINKISHLRYIWVVTFCAGCFTLVGSVRSFIYILVRHIATQMLRTHTSANGHLSHPSLVTCGPCSAANETKKVKTKGKGRGRRKGGEPTSKNKPIPLYEPNIQKITNLALGVSY